MKLFQEDDQPEGDQLGVRESESGSFLPDDVLLVRIKRSATNPQVIEKLQRDPGLRHRPPNESSLRPSGEKGPWCFVSVDIETLLECIDKKHEPTRKAFNGGASPAEFREFHVLIYRSEWQNFRDIMVPKPSEDSTTKTEKESTAKIKITLSCIFTRCLRHKTAPPPQCDDTPDLAGFSPGEMQAVSKNLPMPIGVTSLGSGEGPAIHIVEKILVMRIKKQAKSPEVTSALQTHMALEPCRAELRDTYKTDLRPRGKHGPWCFAPILASALDKLEKQYASRLKDETPEFRKSLGLKKEGQDAKFREFHVLLFSRDKPFLEEALLTNVEDSNLLLDPVALDSASEPSEPAALPPTEPAPTVAAQPEASQPEEAPLPSGHWLSAALPEASSQPEAPPPVAHQWSINAQPWSSGS